MAFSEDDLKFLKAENRSSGRYTVYTIISIILVAGFVSLSVLNSHSKPVGSTKAIPNQSVPQSAKSDARQVLDELHELQRRREKSIQEAKEIVTSLKAMQTPSRTQAPAAISGRTTSQSRPIHPAKTTAATLPKPEIQKQGDPFKAYRAYSEAENARLAAKNARERAAIDRNEEAKQIQILREANIQALEEVRKEAQNSNQSVYKKSPRRYHIFRSKEPPSFKPDQP